MLSMMRIGIAFAVMMSGCDLFAQRWEREGSLPASITVDATLGLSSSRALFFGHSRGDLADRKAAVFVWSNRDVTKSYENDGFFVSADGRGAVIWAVRARRSKTRDGSDYFLIRSDDAGARWREMGAIPGTSIVQVVAVSHQEAWVRGVGELFRSIDSGVTWKPVAGPRAKNIYDETLSSTSRGVAVLTDRIFESVDGGTTWHQRCADCREPRLLDHDVVLCETAPNRFELRFSDGMWSKPIAYEMRPHRLDVAGRHVRVIGSPTGSDVGTGLVLFEAHGSDRTFAKSKIPVPRYEGVDLAPGEAGFAVDASGNVLVSRRP